MLVHPCPLFGSIGISFTDAYPINTELYNSEMEKIYKEAFLKVITNKKPLINRRNENEVIYETLLRGVTWMNEEEFFEIALKKLSKYYYIDHDGDGLPELTIDTDGPKVLKYIPESDKVYLIYGGGNF